MGKHLKHLTGLVFVSFAGIIVLSGFCLAMEKHSCCQPQASDCPIQLVQKVSTPKNGKIIKPAPAKPLHNHRTEVRTFFPVVIEYLVDCRLPNFYLSARIAHQANAPPQA